MPILWLALAAIVLYCLLTVVRMVRAVIIMNHSASGVIPFVHHVTRPDYRFLVIGDSMIFGAALQDPANTVGGQLAERFPTADILTIARNGAKIKTLTAQLSRAPYEQYNLILIGIGANNVVGMTPFARIDHQLRAFLKIAEKRTDPFIFMHSGNLGNIGFFWPPLTQLMSYRSRRLSQLYQRIATDFPTLHYVNFYRPRQQDFYNRHTRHKFLAIDKFHGSDYAYRFFFQELERQVDLRTLVGDMRSSEKA